MMVVIAVSMITIPWGKHDWLYMLNSVLFRSLCMLHWKGHTNYHPILQKTGGSKGKLYEQENRIVRWQSTAKFKNGSVRVQ